MLIEVIVRCLQVVSVLILRARAMLIKVIARPLQYVSVLILLQAFLNQAISHPFIGRERIDPLSSSSIPDQST